MTIETTQIMDRIYMEHGLKLSDLLRAIKHFDLDKDADIKLIKEINKKKVVSSEIETVDEMKES